MCQPVELYARHMLLTAMTSLTADERLCCLFRHMDLPRKAVMVTIRAAVGSTALHAVAAAAPCHIAAQHVGDTPVAIAVVVGITSAVAAAFQSEVRVSFVDNKQEPCVASFSNRPDTAVVVVWSGDVTEDLLWDD